MSTRQDEFKQTSSNPAVKFLQWKSNDKKFSYYDKEEGKNVFVDLPFKFLTLTEMHTVKGWNDASESGIYSNEVKFISKEELNVRSFKGGEIAKGIYKEIKEQIVKAGGHYSKSIYILVEGEICNLQLKGSGVQSWGDFTQKTRSRLSDEWITVNKAQEMKKGSIKYSVPVFEFNSSLSDTEAKIADEQFDILKEYLEGYKATNEREADVEKSDDSMPF